MDTTGKAKITRSVLWLLLLLLAAMVCSPAWAVEEIHVDKVQRSLLGTKLTDPDWTPRQKHRLEEDLRIARTVLKAAPDRASSWIWVGRRLTYLDRYPEAIKVYTKGLQRFPKSYELYRFRGRALARSRKFRAAISDYTKGLHLMKGIPDSYEPDGIINKERKFLGSYRANLLYYRAQTYWALGDYTCTLLGMQNAAIQPLVQNPDVQVATAYWRYLALRKLGFNAQADTLIASVPDNLNLLENAGYYAGVKYAQGVVSRKEIMDSGHSLGMFMVAMMDAFDGKIAGSRDLLKKIIMDSPRGFWPAETELLSHSVDKGEHEARVRLHRSGHPDRTCDGL